MKILATYNIKGGVGKTSAAVNLAYLSTLHGARTLVWDLDPQGAATFCFRVKAKVKGGGKKLVRGKRPLLDRIRGTDFEGLDLLPADFSNRHLDLILDGTKKATGRLARRLRPLAGEYDYVFLDCAPSISLVSEAIFAAADVLVVPTVPTTLSLRTLSRLTKHLRREGIEMELLPFFSMVDRRKSLHREVCDASGDRPIPFLESWIPYSSVVEQMSVRREPLAVFARSSRAGRAYAALWDEIAARVA
jgi:cellulose biosynthesis protein BcsQ